MSQDPVDRFFSTVGPLRAETSAMADLDDAAYLKAVGQRIFDARRHLGMTRLTLARQSGISERYVTLLEVGRGNVSILLLRAVARALGTTPGELLDSASAAALGHLAGGLGETELEEAHGLLARHFSARSGNGRERRILLIGMQGAGKRTLGRALAAARQVAFFELDAATAAVPGRRATARSFGLMEQRAIERVIADNDAAVITAWASLSATPRSFSLLQRGCLTIWLRATPEEHLRRAGVLGTLGTQAARRAMSNLTAILAAHEPMLVRADHVLDTTGLTETECLERLIRLADSP
ncbi:MAG: helix-turn-helix domain-containing protein [Alphaproteobacteria bacterium]|nr:helix-turn-helix domain-containing protein [Alphaproteobacteria bacterium]